MENGAVGEVKISTKLDNKGVERGWDQLSAKIKKDAARMTAAFDRETQSIKRQEAALASMKSKHDELAKGNKQATSVTQLEKSLKRVSGEYKAQKDLVNEIGAQIERTQFDLDVATANKDAQGLELFSKNLKQLEADFLPALEKERELREETGRLKGELSQLRMDPTATLEAKKLANEISLAEGKLEASVTRANELRNSLLEANNSLQSPAEANPFKESIDYTLQAVTAVNAELQQQQHEFQNLLALYDQAEAALRDATARGDQAAMSLAQSNMDKLLSDVARVKSNVQTLSYDAAKLSENFNTITLDPRNADDAAKMRAQISGITFMLEDAKTASSGLNQEIHDAFDFGGQEPEQEIREVSNRIRETGNTAKKTAPKMKTLRKETDRVGKSARNSAAGFQRFGMRLRSLVAGAFVFNILRRGLRALAEGLGSVLKGNSRFAASLNNIKVNLMTAFAPIYNYVLPAVLKLMNALEGVTYAIARFAASLFGQSYNAARQSASNLYDQAKAADDTASSANNATGAINNQAKATDDLAKAAKESKKELASFDEINQLGNSALDTDAFGDAAKDVIDDIKDIEDEKDKLNFDFDPQAGYWGKFEELLNRIKDILTKLFDPVKASWDRNGKAVTDALKYALTNIWELIKAIGRDFLAVWQSDTGARLLDAIWQLLATILLIIGDIANAFLIAWTNGEVGRLLIEAIFNMVSAILELLISIGTAFREAWNDGTGVAILTNILEIVTGVANIIGTFAEKLREAWEANDNGVRIWDAILGLANDILTAINDIVQATLEWIKKVDFTPLMSGVASLLEAFRGLAGVIVDALGWAYENVLLPLMGWLIELFVPKALELLASVFKVITVVLEALKPIATWVWESFLQPLAKWAGERIIGLIELLTKAFTAFSDWARENREKIELIAEIILSFFAVLWTYNTAKNIASFLVKTLVPALVSLVRAITSMGASGFGAAAGLVALITTIIEIAKHWEIMNWAEKTIAILGALAIMAGTAAIAMAAVKGPQYAIAGAAMIAAGILAATLAINSAKNRAQSQMPHLAEGAVLYPNRPFAAIVGDQKRGVNVEAPLDTIKQAVAEALAANPQGGAANVTISFEGELAQLGRVLNPVIKQEEQRVGKSMSSTLVPDH